MLNRCAVVIRLNQPFVDWINAADSNQEHRLTLERANNEPTVYLVEVEEQEEFEQWLKSHHEILFEEELNSWYTDPALWPQDRSLKTFKEWCSFEFHSVVIDTGGSLLYDDEIPG